MTAEQLADAAFEEWRFSVSDRQEEQLFFRLRALARDAEKIGEQRMQETAEDAVRWMRLADLGRLTEYERAKKAEAENRILRDALKAADKAAHDTWGWRDKATWMHQIIVDTLTKIGITE